MTIQKHPTRQLVYSWLANNPESDIFEISQGTGLMPSSCRLVLRVLVKDGQAYCETACFGKHEISYYCAI